MACYRPRHGFRAPDGTIHTSRSGAYSDLPVTTSCGQCWGCRLERSRQWAVRCIHEAQLHEHNSFLTLTYRDEKLPPNKSLVVKDWQNFAKRLRKRHGPFRFLHCGEYGERNDRPHYHAAIFGLDFKQDRIFRKNTPAGFPLYQSDSLDKCWQNGFAWIGELTFDSASYVARYIMKKQNGDRAWIKYGEVVDEATGEVTHKRIPEYTTMSRRPGIGSVWIEKYMDDVYPRDQVIVNGKPMRPPKFYDQEYEKRNPKGFKRLKARRRAEAKRKEDDNGYERLEVKEIVARARTTAFTRREL